MDVVVTLRVVHVIFFYISDHTLDTENSTYESIFLQCFMLVESARCCHFNSVFLLFCWCADVSLHHFIFFTLWGFSLVFVHKVAVIDDKQHTCHMHVIKILARSWKVSLLGAA